MTDQAPHLKFLQLALEQAKIAVQQNEVPVGAVIIKDQTIISLGYNLKEKLNDPTAHAEIMAIRNATQTLGSWRLEGCIVYTTLEPCLMCLAALQHARISKVVYGAKDPKGGAASLGYLFNDDKRLNHRFELIYEEMIEGSELLSSFFKQKRIKS